MPPSRWLVTRLSASLPKPRPVTLVLNDLRRSCGVARSTPSFAQMSRMRASSWPIGWPRGPANTKPAFGSSSPASSARIARTGSASHTRCAMPYVVPGPSSSATSSPGISHQPSTMCSHRMWATSPGLWPESKITLSAEEATSPASSNATQNRGCSESASTRSRSRVALRSTPRHAREDFLLRRPCEDRGSCGQHLVGKDGGLDARHHGAHVGAGEAPRLELAPARQQVAADQGVGLYPRLVVLLGVQVEVLCVQVGEGPGAALGPFLRRRVLALGNREHGLGRQYASVGKVNSVGIAVVQPAWTAVVAVDGLPRLRTGGLHPDGETVLQGVPHEIGFGLGLELANEKLGQATLVGRALGAGRRHVNGRAPAKARLKVNAKLYLTAC